MRFLCKVGPGAGKFNQRAAWSSCKHINTINVSFSEISTLNELSPSVFNEGVIVSGMCLTAVDNDSHQFIVLRDCDFLPGRPSWGAVTSPLDALNAAVLTSHPSDSVGLHVQHPGELQMNNTHFKSYSHFCDYTCCDQCIRVNANLGIRNPSHPNLFIVFDGTSTFPVEAETHEMNAEDAGQGFDACPLHCGSLCSGNTQHTVSLQDFYVEELKHAHHFTTHTPSPCISHSSRRCCPQALLL